MNIDKALKLLGFTDICEINSKDLSKRFKKLARQHHPDLFHSDEEKMKQNEIIMKDINSAYDVLRGLADKLAEIQALEDASLNAKRQEIFAIIPFSKLITIYDGEAIILKSSNSDGSSIKLTKYNIRANRIFIMIECNISYMDGGLRKSLEFSTFKPYILNDRYDIYCEIPLHPELEKCELEVAVKVADKSVNVKLKQTTTRLKLSFKNNVYLEVSIEKRLAKSD